MTPEQNRSYKINEETALRIIDMLYNRVGQKTICSELSVSPYIVADIAKCKTWKRLGYHPQKQMALKEKEVGGGKKLVRNSASRFTRPYTETVNPNEHYDLIDLGPLAKDIMSIKSQIASGTKMRNIVGPKNLYKEIKYRNKYMCIAPYLNSLIYK